MSNDLESTGHLLREIEGFLARSGMAATTFGRKAVNNWKLVDRLRAGGDVTLGQAQRIRAFIAGWDQTQVKFTPRMGKAAPPVAA